MCFGPLPLLVTMGWMNWLLKFIPKPLWLLQLSNGLLLGEELDQKIRKLTQLIFKKTDNIEKKSEENSIFKIYPAFSNYLDANNSFLFAASYF